MFDKNASRKKSFLIPNTPKHELSQKKNYTLSLKRNGWSKKGKGRGYKREDESRMRESKPLNKKNGNMSVRDSILGSRSHLVGVDISERTTFPFPSTAPHSFGFTYPSPLFLLAYTTYLSFNALLIYVIPIYKVDYLHYKSRTFICSTYVCAHNFLLLEILRFSFWFSVY